MRNALAAAAGLLALFSASCISLSNRGENRVAYVNPAGIAVLDDGSDTFAASLAREWGGYWALDDTTFRKITAKAIGPR